jgi:hypothetical protein
LLHRIVFSGLTIMVGAAPGGPTDTIARNLAPYLRAFLGQAIIIENNGSAGGSIVHGRTARAAPDGYILSLGHNMSHGTNGANLSTSKSVFPTPHSFSYVPRRRALVERRHADVGRHARPEPSEMKALNITGDRFHPEWNYKITPRQQPP